MEKLLKKTEQQVLQLSKPFLDKFNLEFKDVFNLFINVAKFEIEDNRLNDTEDIYSSVQSWYLSQDLPNLKDNCTNLILNIEPYLKKIYYLKGEINKIEKRFSYFMTKLLKHDSRMTPDKITKFYTDKNIDPSFFDEFHYFGSKLRQIYDLRNTEGHFNPEYNPGQIINIFNDIISVFLYCTAFFYKDIELKFNLKSNESYISDWNIFSNMCNNFSENYDYFLITGQNVRLKKEQYAHFANINWSVIFDFDNESSINGLSNVALKILEKKTAVQKITHNSKAEYKDLAYPENCLFWYFAKGLRGISDSDTKDFFEWKIKYSQLIKETLIQYSKKRSRKPITVVILYNENKFIEELIGILNETLGEKLNYIFATENNYKFKDILNSETVRCKKSDISFMHLVEGFRTFYNDRLDRDIIYLPCHPNKGKSISISMEEYNKIKPFFEILDLNILDKIEELANEKNFYQGRKIYWNELDSRKDIDRDITKEIKKGIEEALKNRSSGEIFHLKYEPGAGATTISRRIAWDLRDTYPTVFLNFYDKKQSIENLIRIFNLTQQPIFLVIDDVNIKDNQVIDIANICESKSIKITILYLKREFNCNNLAKNEYFLKLTLSPSDRKRFLGRFKELFPEKIEIYSRIDANNKDKELTPFFLGLIAYEKEYISIPDYVRIRMDNMTDKQKELIIMLSFFTYYASGKDIDIPSYIISKLLNLKIDYLVLQNELQENIIYDLILETRPLYWKTLHYLVAEEIIIQTLGQNNNGDIDYINITEYSKKYIELFKTLYKERPNDEIIGLLTSIFIKRNDNGVEDDCIENSADEFYNPNIFSKIITHANQNEKRIEILAYLAQQFEGEEVHFYAHLARLYSICQDYPNAHENIDKGLKFMEDMTMKDAYVLYHIKGTIYRAEAYSIKDTYLSQGNKDNKMLDRYKELFKLASENFKKVRELIPNKDYGYKTEIQFITHAIEFGLMASSFERNGEYCKFLSSNEGIWFKDVFNVGIELIKKMEFNNVETSRIKDLKTRLNKYIDNPGLLIQQYNNLLMCNNTKYSKDILRRNIVNTYFAKNNFDYNKIDKNTLNKMESHLKENLKSNNNGNDIKLWFEVSRRLNRSIDEKIKMLEYNEFYSKSIESAFYLYCMYYIKAIKLNGDASLNANKYIDICKNRRDKVYSKIFCQEWLGKDEKLINYRYVGEWDRRKNFFEDDKPANVDKIKGTIKYVEGHNTGYIELECGLEAIFVPGVEFQFSNNSYEEVEFYLGFNYNGPRAFKVSRINNKE